MKLDLEVIASTNIQRRKPWPKILWIGEEQESLLLLDAAGHRTSVLYVPSGKTKRKLPKLSTLVEKALCYSRTKNGRYLLGLLQTGELFVWHKDKDVVKLIPGLNKQTKNYQAVPCYITASDDCAHVFLAVGTSLFFLWEMEMGESISKDRDAELKGTWHKVLTPTGMELPNTESKECSLAGIFYTSRVLGICCQFSIIYNSTDMLSIITLLLRFPDPVDSFGKGLPLFSAEWSLLEYPFEQMHPNFEPICTAGSYVSSYCGSGQVLAVAANQRKPSQTVMLFVSPLTDTVLVAGMKGCGVSDPNKAGRHYWVSDLAWTYDSLFLVCILKNGSVCVMSRLGEPVIIQTEGCSVSMGPSHYLALHPAIFVSDNNGSLEPSAAEQDPMRQHFSLATHPSLPIVLFSDGFLVTVVQLPADVSSATMMRDLVLASARYLKKVYEQENLDMTVADAYKLSKGQRNTKQAQDKDKLKKVFEFELAEISLNSTHESEVSIIDTTNKFGFDQFGAIGNMDAGKIVFGEPEMISVDPNATFSGLDASEALLKYLEESMTTLVLSWKLAATYSDMWIADVDNIAKQTVHNLSKIFSIVLDCPAVEAIIPVLTPRQSSAIQNPRVYNIIVAYRNLLQLLRFDKFNQHLIPSALRLVHKTITLMLTSSELERTDPRLKTLFGCYSLLKHAEASLNRIYDLSATQNQNSSPSNSGPNKFVSTLMEKFGKQSIPQLSGTSQQVHQMPLPGRRLAMTWKLLYKHLLQYQSKLLGSGDPSGELQHLEKLMSTIQQTLQESDSDITPRRASAKLSIGDKLSVDGDHTLAVEAWKEQLKVLAATKADSPRVAKMLHSILYTHLVKGELGQAVDFVDSLIMQASVAMATSGEELPVYDDGTRPPLMTLVSHRSQDSNEEELVPCIKNKSIRQTVQTMARFMAAYFSNEPMFVFPPHSAQALPSIHMGAQPTKSRIIPKYHEDLTNIIRRDNLSGVWTTERTVEYLLLSGLICETAWFASKMGDWKTAYMLSVAHVSHKDIAPFLYKKPKKPLQLPDSLSPGAVIQDKLLIMIQSNTADSAPVGKGRKHKRYFIPINQETNIPQLTRTLQDVFMAGIICQVELAPWFLASLVEKLKSVVAGLPSLVPEDFYLPSPPLYCPQPGEIEMSTERPDVEYEKELRLEISSLIQLILVAFNSAHLSLPVARWYVQELFKVQERAAQFKSTTEGPCLELPEILQQYKILRSTITDFRDDPHVHQVLSSFRDFCSVLWLLHVRDELSMQLRKRGNQLHNEKKDGQDSAESTLAQSWVQECFKTIKWAVQLLAFSQYITDDGCIHKVLLSLILELPPTEDIADILAEHFYMAESLDPEVQEKLERVLSNWTSIEIVPEDDGKSARLDENQNDGDKNDDDDEGDDVRKSVTFYDASPRAKTLSVYYHKQCDIVQKVMKKKRKCFGNYEEFVFSSQQTSENSITNGGSLYVGARPFETKQSYLEFLDRFYAISFTKLVEQESEQSRNLIFPSLMPFSKFIREAEFEAYLKQNEESYQKKPASIVLSSPRAKFIRSQSESHVQDAGDPDTVVSTNQKNRGLFRSSSSGDVQPPRGSNLLKYRSEGSLMVKNSPRNRSQRPTMSPSRATPNMTGMASRFFQSEDVLYRELSESQEAHWILDVNFGESYLSLQRLLDWLHHWCCKQHSLGLHGKNEKDMALKPTMRIEVPTQLVILSLWLLEHKYSKSKKKKAAQNQNEVMEKNINIAEENFVDDKPKLMKQKALATVEEVTEHDSFTQVSNIAPRSRSHSPYQSRNRSPGHNRSRSHSPAADSREATLDYYRSITSTMEETEQIHSAYKKVLNDDESSSLEVSSLEPDEYEDDMKLTLSMIGSEHKSRSRTPKKKSKSGRRQEKSSPDSRNNSTLNNTLHFEVSPERANVSQNAPQTSTPLRNSRRKNREEIQEDISHISLPPSGQPGLYTAPPRGNINNNAGSGVQAGHNTAPPDHYRGGLLGGDPAHTVPGIGSQGIAPVLGSQAADLGQQLQQIVRGELRRMLEVQHQSMLAMMGALDGQVPQIPQIPVAWQPDQTANQRPAHPSSRSLSPPRRGQHEDFPSERQRSPQGKNVHRGVLSELHNLQISEEKEGRRRSRSPGSSLKDGKENRARSALHMSDLRGPNVQQEDIQLYRVEHGDPSSINFAPKFLRIPAERDTDVPLRFPHIPSEAWGQRQQVRDKENIPEMPLLHVDRTVPGHVFPGSQRSRSLPRYVPQQGYFQAPQGPEYQPAPAVPRPASEGMESPDSGIGIPLLRIPTEDEHGRRQPRFGELLPPDVVIENERERQQKELLREKYAREFHQLHAKQSDERDRQRFGENLLHLNFKREEDQEIERQVKQMMKKQKSPRKVHEPVSEEISSRREVSKKSSARPRTPESPKSKSKSISISRRSKSVHGQEGEEAGSGREEAESGEEGAELGEDETEADSMEEEEEAELHDGYAFRQGEFEAYLALEKELAQTKDTNARIQLMTALKLQQRRMVENWKKPRPRPKVDFATMTREYVDTEMATDIAMEAESIRTAEKYTSITKDTGVDPIQEAVIEYNKSRQPAVLPPDIYMGLRFADAGQQPSSDVTGQQDSTRGRAYLNVVDVDASAILKDLHEKPERDVEARLDDSMPATQAHLRDRIAQEPGLRESLEPVIERPMKGDELTVKMFETKALGEDRLSIAIMPRDSLPESKAAIISRLRDMNQQLAAINRMSNNMEREFKNTRLAIGTLEQMTEAMELPAPGKDRHREVAIAGEEEMGPSPAGSRSLTPQMSAKSPTLSARATARSTARSKKSTVEDKQILSTELAKMSGLSGISDIIGDMVAKGEINLEDAGLTQREADHLVKRGAIRHEEIEEARVSLDEIKQMAKTVSRAPDFSRDNLHEWMATRRHKQMEEYKKHIDELREREPNPFKHKLGELDHSLSTRKLQESEQARQDHRKISTRTFMSKRLEEAQHLLGNILTDKPDLPKEPTKPAQKHKLQRKDTSPAAKERKGKPYAKEYSPSSRRVTSILKTREVSPGKARDYSPLSFRSELQPQYPDYDEDVAVYDQHVPSPREAEPAPRKVHKVLVAPVPEKPKRMPARPHPGVPRLKLSLEDVDEEPRLQHTVETTGDLSEYARAMEAMDESQEHFREVARQPEQEEEKPAPPVKPYKMKPYTEIVKVQRPEVTRKKPAKVGVPYVGRVPSVSVSQSEAGTARTEPTQREREMIYGSKRLPMKKPTETTPRRVKTYTERLQEMKSEKKFSTPIAPRSQYGSSVASASARDTRSVTRVVKPKHKPMTYVEQLQKLNAGTHKPRMGQTTVVKKTMIKSHKATHRPKTYAQQLQELQPPKPLTGPPSKRSFKPPVTRQRPYKDPYMPVTQADYDQWERESMVSAWSMGDDVRHILYDDVESSIAVGQSASYAPSEQISDYYDAVMGDDYTASVDIDELVRIADNGSDVSGSLISQIDWDEVENLIADVS